jgi:fructose-bisphosphate aldolase, class I
MFEETLYQSTKDGKPFVDVLSEQGIKPGIKVDTGLAILPGSDGETSTQGLDGLGDRMRAFREQARNPRPLPLASV